MYKLFTSSIGSEFIIRLSDNAFIPVEEANTDYQEYIKWTKASPKNKALPADE